jgi:UDP-glucose 4-epimerase
MKILITGGAGLIGSQLTDTLVMNGHKVCVYDAHLNFIDKPHYYRTALEHRKKMYTHLPEMVVDADIQNTKDLREAFDNFRPEVVVHLAGLPMARPLAHYENSMIPINMDGTLRVLEAFEQCPSAKRFVYTSSSMTYGHFTQTPQPEEVMLNPINSYGACKAAGEYFVKLSKKEWVIVRPTSVYGYADAANRVTQILLDAALTGKSAWVVRGETLDFTYIDDVVDGFVKCVESPSAMYQTFNISRGEPRSASDFAEILKKYFPTFTYEVREPASTQVFRGALDISKASKLLGYTPKFTIEQGIEKMLDLAKKYKWVEEAYKG